MTGQSFPIKPFFFPSCSAVVLRGTNTGNIILLVILLNSVELKAEAMKNSSHNPRRLAQAQ